MMQEVLDLSVLVPAMVGLLGLAVWFCCSVAEHIAKTRRRMKDSTYGPLLTENKRLKGLLAEIEEENFHLGEIYRFEQTHHKSNAGQNAA